METTSSTTGFSSVCFSASAEAAPLVEASFFVSAILMVVWVDGSLVQAGWRVKMTKPTFNDGVDAQAR